MTWFSTDLRVTARGLWNARGFTTVAVATLALGIGATSAMFTVLRASLSRPAPFPESDRLAVLFRTSREPGRPVRPSSWPVEDIGVVRATASSFEDIGLYIDPYFTLTG